MTPGTYLRKRREAAGLTLPMVADRIAALPWAIRPATVDQVRRMAVLLRQAEGDDNNLTVPQAMLLRNVYGFDVDIYQSLLLRHSYGPAIGVAAPQLCRYCACSWQDACTEHGNGCAWVPGDPTLCTSCLPRAAQEARQLHAAEAELREPSAAAAAELNQAGVAA